ncbi:MAG: acylphosphatase [Candidatus Thermoplasmatota archaeon]|nr:acylphosphatase [Candidatus Thermoplasmatota archaeon]MCG2826595.1 acylphosphatase [Thermoplasmatales archaeon]
MMLNKRIVIEGEKVHNVGYRPFLLSKAWELNVPNYFARNIKEEDGVEQVEVYLGGDEEQVQEFIEFIKNNYPPKAKVSGVREGEPPGRVMQIDKYDRVLSAEQQNTVVQTGLIMLDKQDQTIQEVKTVGKKVDNVADKVDNVSDKIDNFAGETNQNFQTMKTDYGKISQDLATAVQSINRIAESIEKLAVAIAEKK